jgi:hypothetical protein
MSQDWRASAHAARARRARMSGLSNYRRASRGGLRLAGAEQRDRARCFGPLTRCSSTGSCLAVWPTVAAKRQHLQESVDSG